MRRRKTVLWVLLCFAFALAGCGSGGGGGSANNDPGSGGGDISGGGGDIGGGTGDSGGSGTIAAKVDITSDMYTQSSAYTLNGTVDPAVTSATISLNSAAVQNVAISENAFSIPLTLKPGYNTLSITSTDSSGATGTTVNYITYDTGQPSSLDLINNALNAGTITSEEALIYKTYAAFNDARLPAQYKGDDSLADYSEITWEINEAYPTLSETEKEVLTPFLIPPFYKGSWHDIQKNAAPSFKSNHQNSKAVSSAAGLQYCEEMLPADWLSVSRDHIKVWYLEKYKDTDGEKANRLATFLEDTVWSKLTTLMGRKPLPDIDMGCNGGDGRLDIALVDNIANPGRTTILKFAFMGYGAEKTPVYILINRNEDLNENFPAAVHEFMHAIQYGINVKSLSLNNDYATLMESTADWAVYYILKKVMEIDSTWHHKSLSFPSSFLQNTDKPYDTKDLNAFPYSESLLALYLSETFGNEIIKEIWEASQLYDQINAIDQAIRKHGSTLEDEWHKFALAVWNDGPDEAKKFQEWDNIKAVPKIYNLYNMSFPKRVPPYDVFFPSNIHDEILTFPGQLPSLSMRYIHLTFTDPKVRSLLLMDGMTFKIGKEAYYPDWDPVSAYAAYKVQDPSLVKGAKMQVLTKVGGKWGVDKEIGKGWSGMDGWRIEGYDTYCRQRKYARIEEMVIILSYSDISSPGKTFTPQGKDPVLYASDIFCGTVKGNAQLSKTYGGFYNNDFTETLTISDFIYDYESYGNGNFTMPEDNNTYTYVNSGPVYGKNYMLTSGSLNWSLTGASDGCSYSGQYTLPINESHWTNQFDVMSFIEGYGNRTYYFKGFTDSLQDDLETTVVKECTDVNGDVYTSYIPWTISSFSSFDFFDTSSQAFTDDGSRIEGRYDCDGCSGAWSLVSQSE